MYEFADMRVVNLAYITVAALRSQLEILTSSFQQPGYPKDPIAV